MEGLGTFLDVIMGVGLGRGLLNSGGYSLDMLPHSIMHRPTHYNNIWPKMSRGKVEKLSAREIQLRG